jgi:hypothetical protein
MWLRDEQQEAHEGNRRRFTLVTASVWDSAAVFWKVRSHLIGGDYEGAPTELCLRLSRSFRIARMAGCILKYCSPSAAV